ncbi:hypothetical protein NMY22_g13749 [Coprinellus aureogranulatus]|nr:hypothetical protein NMY22_g13749 [Coprinellus aureogranulatus]
MTKAESKKRPSSGCSETAAFHRQDQSLTWIHSSTRLYHFAVIQEHYKSSLDPEENVLEAVRLKTHPGESLENLVVTYPFANSPAFCEDRPELSTVAEFLTKWSDVKAQGRLGEFGVSRFEETVTQFASDPNIRLVEGIFALNDDCSVWVLCRLRCQLEIRAIGGFSALVYSKSLTG